MMEHILWHLELVVEMKIIEHGMHSTTYLQWLVLLCHLWRMIIFIQSSCLSWTGTKDWISPWQRFSQVIIQQIVFIILNKM